MYCILESCWTEFQENLNAIESIVNSHQPSTKSWSERMEARDEEWENMRPTIFDILMKHNYIDSNQVRLYV